MRKRHNLRRKPVGCAFILFAKLQCIILASRPFGYPNGSLPAFCTISASRPIKDRLSKSVAFALL